MGAATAIPCFAIRAATHPIRRHLCPDSLKESQAGAQVAAHLVTVEQRYGAARFR